MRTSILIIYLLVATFVTTTMAKEKPDIYFSGTTKTFEALQEKPTWLDSSSWSDLQEARPIVLQLCDSNYAYAVRNHCPAGSLQELGITLPANRRNTYEYSGYCGCGGIYSMVIKMPSGIGLNVDYNHAVVIYRNKN